MKIVNILALVLVIVGALNWGLIGLMGLNLVTTLFGEGTSLTNIVYILVGVAAIWVALIARSAVNARPF